MFAKLQTLPEQAKTKQFQLLTKFAAHRKILQNLCLVSI